MSETGFNQLAKLIITVLVLIVTGIALVLQHPASQILLPFAGTVIGYWFGVSQPTPGVERVVRLVPAEPSRGD